MAASIGRSKIDEFVADVKKLGLTADDVKADANELADALKHSADTADTLKGPATTSVDQFATSMHKAGEEADNTRSVVANFAGNAAQELPGLANAMGPLNMAIGQFAEYASEGNIKLKNFAAAGAGLGVAALAMKGIQDRMAKIAEIDAFSADRVHSYAVALHDAESNVQAIKDTLDEAAKIEFLTGDANGGFWTGGVAKIQDVTTLFERLGVNSESAAKLIAGGEPMIRGWGDAMVNAGAKADEVGVIVGTLLQQSGYFNEALKNESATIGFLSEDTANLTEERDRGLDTLNKNTSAVHDSRMAQEALTRANENAEQAERNKNDAIRAGIDANFAAYDAANQYTQALEDYTTTTDDAKTAVDEHDQSMKNAEQAAINLASQAAELGAKQAEMAGETMTAKEKQDLMVGALQMTVSQLEPGSPLRKSLEEYIALLAGIPANVNTQFTHNGTPFTIKPGSRFATGTSSSPAGPALVNDAGPEIIDLPNGSRVYPAGLSARMASAGGGGTTVVNQVNNIRTNADYRQLQRALKLSKRRGATSPW